MTTTSVTTKPAPFIKWGDDVAKRLMSKIQVDEKGCWNWTAALHGSGYGIIGVNKRTYRAHRISYEIAKGPIPDGLFLDHLCRNRACINPDHLEPVTNRENIQRGQAPSTVIRRSGYCSHGHEMAPENTYWRKDRPNQKLCKECRRQGLNRWYSSHRTDILAAQRAAYTSRKAAHA